MNSDTDKSRLLALLVIEQAKRDFDNPLLIHVSVDAEDMRDNARSFLSGVGGHKDVLEGWCDWAKVRVGDVRELVE